MKKVLFVTDKWCDLNPNLGLTNNYHNMFKTFEQYNVNDKYTYDILHLDEASINYNQHIDEVLPAYHAKWGADIVIFCLLGGMTINPSIDTYKYLRDKGVFLCIIWPDTGPEWGLGTIKELNPNIDLHVSWDNPYSIGHGYYHQFYAEPLAENHICLWTPEDSSLYHYEDNKDIDVSFMGSIEKYRDRMSFIDLAKQLDCNIYIGGGQRTGRLTPNQYADIIRRSKIGINFAMSQTGVFYQAKGRIFEYTACGGLLLESKNPSVLDFYEPNKDYVPFDDLIDLLDKIEFYLNNEDERKKIAEQGYRTFMENWTGQKYWKTLMESINER